MEIADSVLLSLSMRDNVKCNICHAAQAPKLNVSQLLIPKDKTKYNKIQEKRTPKETAKTLR